jgi:hypothetical protein
MSRKIIIKVIIKVISLRLKIAGPLYLGDLLLIHLFLFFLVIVVLFFVFFIDAIILAPAVVIESLSSLGKLHHLVIDEARVARLQLLGPEIFIHGSLVSSQLFIIKLVQILVLQVHFSKVYLFDLGGSPVVSAPIVFFFRLVQLGSLFIVEHILDREGFKSRCLFLTEWALFALILIILEIEKLVSIEVARLRVLLKSKVGGLSSHILFF